MRQLVYMMQVTGQATPVGLDGGVLAMMATAPGWTVLADVGAATPTSDWGCLKPGEAAFASELTLTGATSYQEVGSVTFGSGHRLRFATVGSGYLGPGPTPADRHGGALWRVEGGDGQFAGVQGLITAQIVVDAALTMTGYHLGVLVVP
jgi:hypothetical protein